MVGVKQTQVASLPPGWEDSEVGQAMKEFAKTLKRDHPEIADALRKINEA